MGYTEKEYKHEMSVNVNAIANVNVNCMNKLQYNNLSS